MLLFGTLRKLEVAGCHAVKQLRLTIVPGGGEAVVALQRLGLRQCLLLTELFFGCDGRLLVPPAI